MLKNILNFSIVKHGLPVLLLILILAVLPSGATASDLTSPNDLILVLNGPVEEEILTPLFNEHSLDRRYRFLAENFYWVHPDHELSESEIQAIANEFEITEVFRKGSDYYQASAGTVEYQKQHYLNRQNTCFLQAGSYAFWDIDAERAWQHTPRRGVSIAILDGGLDITHPDLVNVIHHNQNDPVNGIDDDGNGLTDDNNGWDFCQQNNDVFPYYQEINHATQIAGIIAAEHNGSGIRGVASKARILPIVVTRRSRDGLGGEPVDAICCAAGLDYAISQNVDIICLPWWGREDYGPVHRLIKRANFLGIAVVVAAGNGDYALGGEAVDLDTSFRYPASYDFFGELLVTVTALASYDRVLGYVNWGNETVDLATFGQYIFSSNSTLSSELYGIRDSLTLNNSSSACAIATGALAFLFSVHDELSMDECIQRLYSTSVKNLNIKDRIKEGRILQLGNALEGTVDNAGPSPVSDFEVVEVGNHHAILQWTAPGGDGLSGQVKGYDISFAPGHPEPYFWKFSRHLRVDDNTPSGETVQLELRGIIPRFSCGIRDTAFFAPSQSYVVVVAAVDSAHNYSLFSNTLEFETTNPVLAANTDLIETHLITGEVRTEEVVVTNSGNGPFPYNVELDPPAPWLSVNPSSGVINPGETLNLQITFDGSRNCVAGAFSRVTLKYAHDILTEEISVGCIMILDPACQLVTSSSMGNFGKIPLTRTSTTNLYVHNVGCRDLMVDSMLMNRAANYTISPESFVVPAESFQTVQISFTPDELGAFLDLLTIESNDPFNPQLVIEISGEVVADLSGFEMQPGSYTPPAVIPNPANPSTTISFESRHEGQLRFSIYDVRGALIRQINRSGVAAGQVFVNWDGRDNKGNCVPSGLYLCEALVGGNSIFSGLKITMLE